MTETIHHRPVFWWSLCVAFLILGVIALFFAVSSGSSACDACGCTYTFRAENWQCRWPAYYAAGFEGAWIIAVICAGLALWRHWRIHKAK